MLSRSSPFLNVRRAIPAARLLAGLGVCGALSGCVENPFADAKVDPRSPIAAEVATAVRPNAAYPTFAAFPKAPTDIRPHAQYGVAAAQVQTDRATLIKATADNTWSLSGTDDFAAKAQADAGPELPPVPAGETEAFAKALKARATPPPPPRK